MRRRPDLTDTLLEHWASWRITLELYEGTGPSAIVRFREPAGTSVSGSRPLFQGMPSRRLSALNADLCIHLGPVKTYLLIALYGLPGEDHFKARRFGISLSAFSAIRRQGRVIARQHLSPARLTIGEHHDPLRTEAAG